MGSEQTDPHKALPQRLSVGWGFGYLNPTYRDKLVDKVKDFQIYLCLRICRVGPAPLVDKQ